MDDIQSYSFRDILRVFYLNKIYFVVFPLLFVLLGYIGYELGTPTFTARVKMYVKGTKITEADFYSGIYPGDIVQEHTELIRSKIVLRRVVNALKLYEIPDDIEKKYATPLKKWLIDYRYKKRNKPEQNSDVLSEQDKKILFESAIGRLSSQIGVIPTKGANLFYLTVTGFNPGLVAKIANSVSRSYIIFDMEQQIEEFKLKYGKKHSLVQQLEGYIKDFEKNLNGELIPDLQAIGPASIKIVSQAEGAGRDRRAKKSILLLFAFFAGIFLAIVLSAIAEYYSSTLKTPKDITRDLQLPFLGSIPKRKKNDELVMSQSNVHASVKCVQSFQRLGDKICLIAKDNGMKTFLVTALRDFEDSSALIANLGLYLSRDAGKKTLIIDANLQAPFLKEIFNLQNGANGLIDIFKRKKSLEDAVVKAGERLDLLLSEKAEFRPILLLDSLCMSSLINEAREKYDIVLIDCSANINTDSEPVIVSSFTDAVIFVMNERRDRLFNVRLALQSIQHNKDSCNIFAVLNNRSDDMPGFLYKIS